MHLKINFFILAIALVTLACISEVWSQKRKPVGKPEFSLQGAGGGKNARNWNAGFQAGVGSKVWESKNKKHSLDIKGTYSQGFVRHQGHTFKSKPDYGFGATYRYRFKGRK